MVGTLQMVVLDAPDIVRLAAFYRGLAGWKESSADAEWITLDTPDGWQIGLQLAPDHQAPQWPGQADDRRVVEEVEQKRLDCRWRVGPAEIEQHDRDAPGRRHGYGRFHACTSSHRRPFGLSWLISQRGLYPRVGRHSS